MDAQVNHKSYSDRMDELETLHQVVVEQCDNSCALYVYKYAENTKISVEFCGMNPPVAHVEAAAKAVAELAEKLK